MTVRFAILGAGRIGQVHARAVTSTPDATLVAIADPVADAAQQRRAVGAEVRERVVGGVADEQRAVVEDRGEEGTQPLQRKIHLRCKSG